VNEGLRAKIRAQETAYGLWVTMESPAVIEVAAELGLDWVVIDLEHGYLSYEHVANHLRAAKGTDLSVIVRVPSHDLEPTKRVLDLGAHGLVIPLVRSAAEVTKIQQYAYYPPRGERGLGGERNVRWGLGLEDYIAQANDDLMIFPMIEVKEAAAAFDEIIALDHIEAVVFGPGDLSSSYGYIGEWEGPGVAEEILDLVNRAKARGIASAVVGRNIPDVLARRDQGFGMVALGSDAGMIVRHISDIGQALGNDSINHRWF
jgi:2-keto-3-deoxy-L-rhamnonate aldolase RhmA